MDDKEIENGFDLVIKNSESLVSESTLLYENGYYARAYSLSQLAIEEVGKSTMLCGAILSFYMGESITIKYLHSLGFHDHKQKTRQSLKSELIAIYLYEKSRGETTNFRESLIDDFTQVDKLDRLKNESLYVGVINDKFSLPSDIVTKDMVEKILEKAKIRLSAAKPLLRSLDSMKSSALRLKEIMGDPKKRDAFHKTVADTLGVKLY